MVGVRQVWGREGVLSQQVEPAILTDHETGSVPSTPQVDYLSRFVAPTSGTMIKTLSIYPEIVSFLLYLLGLVNHF